MKQQIILLISIIIIIPELSACGFFSKNIESNNISTTIPNPYVSQNYDTKTDKSSYEHKHLLSEGNNYITHDVAGYCGNTMTIVSQSQEILSNEKPWEISFCGNDSVKLTDLLRYLNYSEDICGCLPEYTVETEFGTGYKINLTKGYVQYDSNQVSLTEEQVTLIKEIFNRQAEQLN